MAISTRRAYSDLRRLPIDPKMVKEIQSSPRMYAEQGGGFLESWGGPGMYQVLSRLPVEERLVYASIIDGATTPSEIEVMTGLTPQEVNKGIEGLQKRRMIKIEGSIS